MNAGRYDKIIIGAGLYGLYAAERCGRRGERVLVLEYDGEAFSRATTINQARVHMGYHYPRSLSTAIKSAGYFERFLRDYDFCIHDRFLQVYATSAAFSWTDAAQFQKFCRDADIPCEEVSPNRYFKPGMVDGCFETVEYTYDAAILRDFFLDKIAALPSVTLSFNARIGSIARDGVDYALDLGEDRPARAPFVLNATYGSVNQILQLAQFDLFKIKYELCEIILCDVDPAMRDVGLTVMDGPFFSIMPFGKTGVHSLTSVTFTPHLTSYDSLPTFPCQGQSQGQCRAAQLGNCNICPARPESAWIYMSGLARKYMRDDLPFAYRESLFSMKPILMNSEIDDSRPTVVRTYSSEPTFVSVLSGKINTVYDLDEVLA